MKLNVKAFAITSGLLWGLGVFTLTWWIIFFDGATGDTLIIGKIYRGFSVSPTGSFIGLGWGLLDGYVGGAIFACLYNKLASKMVE